MKQTKILIADDDHENRWLLLMAIVGERTTVSVTSASSRAEMLDAARSERFDCIVLDYGIPPYTASGLIRDIEPLQPGVPCIVVTSSDEQYAVIESIQHGVVDFVRREESLLPDRLWNLIERLVRTASTQKHERRRTNRRVQRLELSANTDPLTGLLNRRGAERVMGLNERGADRRLRTSVVLLDLDHFSQINEGLGHAEGDRVLKEMADVLRCMSRPGDIVARWGGEEFLVLRQSDTITQSWLWANRLRRETNSRIQLPAGFREQTVSIGVDTLCSDSIGPQAVVRVERALLLAKDSGRDRVCTWPMVHAMDTALELGSMPEFTPRERLLALIDKLDDGLGPTQHDHTGSHGLKVRRLASALWQRNEDLEMLELAAEFHDIGKLAIPEELLALPRRLSDEERMFIDEHARFGADLLRACGATEEAAHAVESHHGWFDSYETGADGTPTLGLVLGACDAVSAMMSDRPYSARTPTQALAELRAGRGIQFHPDLVDEMHFMDPGRLLAA